MHIEVRTDSSIKGGEVLLGSVEQAVRDALDRFSDRITRVEVHLNDVNGPKEGSDDNRCMIEARPAGLQPISVSHNADSLPQAVDGATRKMQRALDTAFGKQGR